MKLRIAFIFIVTLLLIYLNNSLYYKCVKKADIKKGHLILVNKYNRLDKNYIPSNMVTIDNKYGVLKQVKKDTYKAFIKMNKDAKKLGLNIYILSAYRSYDYQYKLYNRYVKNDGLKKTNKSSAKPGYSEHQTGLAIDVSSGFNVPLNEFGSTKEYEWLINNSYKYGFILRYPKGKENITGYMYEPWHYRYLGVDIATKVYKSGLTYDEYYAYYIR